MAVHAHSTRAPARPLLPRDPLGRFIKAAPAERAELPPEPLLSASGEGESIAPAASAANDSRDDNAPQSITPLEPSSAGRAAPSSIVVPDPAFAAVRAFDLVVAEWDGAFADYLGIMEALDPAGCRCWDDPPAVARAVLGPIAGSTVAALDRLLRRMEALDARHEAAEARLLSTRAASEIGAAALRAAVRRYARRPFGCRSDEAVMPGSLAA